MKDTDILYERYKSKNLKQIRKYLKNIKIVEKKNDNYYSISDNDMKDILEKPRNVSFTFNIHSLIDVELNLTILKTIPFLVKSSTRFFLKPDIGEVFDQIDENDINQTSAIYVDSNNYKIINSEGDHFLMEAVLLTNIRMDRKLKLEKIDEIYRNNVK
jgi:hypothetical protein